MGYYHVPGYAVWKFVTEKVVIYRKKNYDALKWYWKYRDVEPFTVYVRSRSDGWDLVTVNTPSDRCQCGRLYTDNATNEPFKFQDHPLVLNIKTISETMSSPMLCQICYYKGELQKGRWAPKYVKQQLGLET
jgi:hypothetical protein